MKRTVQRKDETTAWPFIKWNETRQRWMVDARTKNGGERKFFEKKPAAEGFAQAARIRKSNEGGAAFDETRLAKYGWTVARAIQFTLEHLDRTAKSLSIKEAISKLISEKRNAGLSTEYCRVISQNLEKAATFFPERMISGITTAEIDEFLQQLKGTGSTRNTMRRDIRTLWSFAEKHGWAIAKTAKNTTRAKVIDQPPGILTPSQTQALMTASVDDELRAFHAIGLFAGLRVAEIKRLNWKDVDLAGGFVHVSATVAKTRSRRLVPITENLKLWLEPVAQKEGQIVSKELRILHEAARRKAGFGKPGTESDDEKKKKVKLVEWPDNGMRHSFVSYRLAATGNAAQTALEAGHDQAVLFRHYRELVKPKDAEAYWQILPEGGPKKKSENQEEQLNSNSPRRGRLDLIAGKIS